jgi:hypothetical protein
MSEPSKSSGTPGSFPDIEKPGRDVKAKRPWVVEAEQTLRAIREGEIDALVVQGDVIDKLYALKSFDELEKADAELKSQRSERRRSDAARRESERRFETLVTHAPVGIFMNDAAGNCTFVNRRCCEILGMPPEDVMGQGWANALHPEDRDRVLCQWHEALRSTGFFESEYRFRWPNGKSVWVAARSIALRDGDGKVTERIGTLSDVTGRKTAELALKEANRKMQTVFDASPLAILSMDALGRIMGWNQGAERMFGWSEQEVIGRVCPTVPDEGLDDFHDMIGFVLSGAPWAGKVRGRRKNSGEVIRASISAAPLLDASGEKIGIVAILDDVTERERVNERLRALVEERERFVQDLHDGCIQSIYAIGLNLEECRQMIREDPRTAAGKIADAAADLNLVIQDLRLSISGDERELAKGHDLKLVLERTIHMLGDRPPAFVIDIDEAVTDSLTPAQAAQLVQIVREGISNAVRHAKARSGRVSLQIRDGAVCLEVSDDGIGFDPEVLEKQGLGLHHIDARARKLGGRSRVVSAPNQGTRVMVEIPPRR